MRDRLGGVVLLAAAIAIGACSTGPSTDAFEVVLPSPADVDLGIEPLPVVVRGPAGVLDGAAAADPAGAAGLPDTTVRAVPGRPDALILDWLGGACDARVEILVEPVGNGLQVTGRTEGAAVLACPAIGIARAVEIDLTAPVDPSLVVFDQGP